MSPASFVLSMVLAAACFIPAHAKLRAHPKMLAAAEHFGIPWARYRLIGVLELAAAGGVLFGLAWHLFGVVAAVGMCVLLAGALVAHRHAGDRFTHALPAAVTLGVSLVYIGTSIAR